MRDSPAEVVEDPFPYDGLAAMQNWHRAVSYVADRRDIDPQGIPKFRIGRNETIASGGSCFARRIAEKLQQLGMHYYIAEQGAEPLSARYGNIYTTVQLAQLLERALGLRDPAERVWITPHRTYLDPFRPAIEPTGWATVEDVEADRLSHLAAVLRMFREIDVFVFTLGLTEVWTDRRDGSAFPLCPGRGRGVFDASRYRWRNLDVAATIEGLQRFLTLLADLNPAAKVILTVSPVPMALTLEKTHVVRASLYAKSILKVAAETVARRYQNVDYFASYDIVNANLGNERFFEEDGRHVRDAVTERVTRSFVVNYFGEERPSANGTAASRASASSDATIRDPYCDEDTLLELVASHDRSARPRKHNGVVELARPSPLYFVGDSHSLVFRDRLIAMEDSDRRYYCKTLYTARLYGRDLCDARGALNPAVMSALLSDRLIMPIGNRIAVYQRNENAVLDVGQEAFGAALDDPPVTLFCGSYDCHTFVEETGSREILLPPEIPQPTLPFEDRSTALEFERAVEVASKIIAPVEAGLRFLRSCGLQNLFLHSLPPPALGSGDVDTLVVPSLLAQYQAVALMNHLLRDICRRTAVTFIDIWPLVVDRAGLRDDRYHLDDHLNGDAAMLSIEFILRSIETLQREKRARA